MKFEQPISAEDNILSLFINIGTDDIIGGGGDHGCTPILYYYNTHYTLFLQTQKYTIQQKSMLL